MKNWLCIPLSVFLAVSSVLIHEACHILTCLVFNISVHRIASSQDGIGVYAAVSPYSQIIACMGGLGSAIALSVILIWSRLRNSPLRVGTEFIIYMQLGIGYCEGVLREEYMRGSFLFTITLIAVMCTVLTEMVYQRNGDQS